MRHDLPAVRLAAALLMLLSLLVVTACSEGNDSGATPGGSYGTPKPGGGSTESCAPGTVSECSIELGTHEGITSCAPGTRTCVDGRWSGCKADTTRETYSVVAPTAARSGYGLQAISQDADDCLNNPCNPYCQNFGDVPDAPVTSTPEITERGWTGGTLAGSNVPPSFKSKGSLNAQCSAAPGSQTYQEACQFDQRCGTVELGQPGCVAFDDDESGSCGGIDITAPTTCIPRNGYRSITVCNRGTEAAPPGVSCYTFAGGSPKYPEPAPSLSHGDWVLTTETTLTPGACETQEVPESRFGSNGIKSLMCNPPGSGAPEVTVETSTGARFPTASSTTTWQNPERGYAADGSWASATSTLLTTPDRYPTLHSLVTGWTNPERARAADGLATSATPQSSGGTSAGLPTTNATLSWTNPSRAYAADEADATQRYTTVTPALPGLGGTLSTGVVYPRSNTGNTCNYGASCAWQLPNNAYASESPPAPAPSWTTTTLSKHGSQVDSASIYFGGYNFGLPSDAIIRGFILRVRWKGNNKIASATVQAYKAGGVTPIGNPIQRNGSGSAAFDEHTAISSSFTPGQVTVADLTDPRFIKLTATHNNTGTNDAIYVDYVSVEVQYQLAAPPTTATLDLGSFGLSLPSGATLASLTTEVKWRVSAANSNVTLSMQPYTDAGLTLLGTARTATATSALTTDTIATHTVPAAALQTLTSAQLANGVFGVRLTATRSTATDGSANPNITASVDYVRVTAVYTTTAGAVSALYGGFQFGLPAGVTVFDLTTEVNWNVTVANPNVLLGAQPYLGGVIWGSELTTGSNVSPPLVATTVSRTRTAAPSGAALTAADLADPNFTVRLRALRSATDPTNDPDTTALVDFVRARVRYLNHPTQTVTYSGFGFDVPPERDLVRLTAEVKWKVSTANANVVLGLQALKNSGATPVGSEVTTTAGSSPPTTDTVTVADIDVSNLTPADLNHPGFALRIRATRGNTVSSNPDFSALVDYVKLTATYATHTGGEVVECNPHNNWSATKAVPDPQPCIALTDIEQSDFTLTRLFQATCGEGQGAVWSYFGYNSSTPEDSKIEFRFRAFPSTNGECVALPAVTSGSPTPLATARSTPTNTQQCPIEPGPSACYVDLYEGLGTPGSARADCLQMDAFGTPTQDRQLAPILYNWTVRFSCVDVL